MAFYCIHCRSAVEPAYKACPHCGEPITDFLRNHLEAPIDGKYQILARLGVGGMGEVYKVVHVHLNAIRVIKLMRPNIAADPSAHERFMREARLATRITHPNVATLFDFSTLPDGSWYMVWEYIEGTNLHDLIEERGPLSPRYAARVSVQALQGLEAIHRAGVVHRDVSPENIMITRDNDGEERVKIIDLGIAKQGGDEGDNQTKTGMFVGKWKYCSPEHLGILPEKQRIDGRADLYSFGIVLYEMLAGVAPFQADTPHGYLLQHTSEKPRPLRMVNPSVKASPEMEAVILRSLEKDRNKRFASAREFAQALEKLVPVLDDSQGEPAPLPLSSEVTYEATSVVPRVDGDAETVVSVSAPTPNDAPTIVTEIAMARRRPAWLLPAAAAVVVVAGIIGIYVRQDPPPVVQKPVQAQTSIIVPATTGRLAINAFPWATVTSIKNVTNGEDVKIDELITPAPIDLSPGKYEITLSNPSFRKPITRVVEVAAGRDALLNVAFSDPANASLPSFQGGAR